jgi:hypothetical protein
VDPNPDLAPNFKVFGWSHGYVGFTSYPNLALYPDPSAAAEWDADTTIVSSYSSDGVHWHKGQTLDVASDQLHGLESVHAVIEGPGGLLAVGWSGGCASYWVEGLWTSTDGVSWRPVDTKKAFGQYTLIPNVSGGLAGYVAVAYDGGGAWTSADGRTWKPVALDAAPFAGSVVDDGTAFSGGYVLVGEAGTRDCTASVGPIPTPPVRSASVWWSADSASWTRIPLPGTTATSDFQATWICRINDRALLVVNSHTEGAWTSSDGRKWTKISLPAGITPSEVLTDGHRGLIVQPTNGSDSISAFSGDLQLIELRQSGEGPVKSYDQAGNAAIGPTGVVVTDGNQLWIGIPSAD